MSFKVPPHFLQARSSLGKEVVSCGGSQDGFWSPWDVCLGKAKGNPLWASFDTYPDWQGLQDGMDYG